MTHEEIIAMARETGIEFQCNVGVFGRPSVTTQGSQKLEKIQRLIELAVAKEREAIAAHYAAQPHVEVFGAELADDIRARVQKEGG